MLKHRKRGKKECQKIFQREQEQKMQKIGHFQPNRKANADTRKKL